MENHTTTHDLTAFPQELRTAVEEYLTKYPQAFILTAEAYESTPLIDKSVTSTRYSVFCIYGNLFTVFRLSRYSDGRYSAVEYVTQSSMIASEIRTFYESSGWFSSVPHRLAEPDSRYV